VPTVEKPIVLPTVEVPVPVVVVAVTPKSGELSEPLLKVAIVPVEVRLLLNPEAVVLELEPENEEPLLPLVPLLLEVLKAVAVSVRFGPNPGARALEA
jgi:hypothetical protein